VELEWEVRETTRTTRRPFDRNARISGSEWAETEERAAGITWSKREMAERLSNMAIQPGDSTLEEVLSVWERRSISKDDLCELMEYWTCEGLREEVGNHVVGIQMLHHDALGGNVVGQGKKLHSDMDIPCGRSW
jgi:hypothetical protein